MLRLAPGLPEAAVDDLAPVSASRSTDGRSRLQCMPAALAMSAAPAIQMPASAPKAMALPNLLTTNLILTHDRNTRQDRRHAQAFGARSWSPSGWPGSTTCRSFGPRRHNPNRRVHSPIARLG